MAKRSSPPYKTIHDELVEGEVIPFLGSGASLCRRTPTGAGWTSLDAQRKRQIDYIPTASELATFLAESANFPDKERDLAKVAQYFDAINGRGLLNKRLNNIFNADFPYTTLHSYLAATSKREKPLLIVTTNYDDLLERAFEDAQSPYDLVVHTTDPDLGEQLLWWSHGAGSPDRVLAKDLLIELEERSVIYKMHGAVDRKMKVHGQYVITEDDYIEFLTRLIKKSAIPGIFALPFQTRPFLFLGYGLYDWNLRVVLSRIDREFRRPNEKIKSWAIQLKKNLVEQKLWSTRNVEVFYQDIEEFVAKLKELD